MSGDTRFGLGTVPCNQRDSQSFSLQVQQDTTILWGLPIYLCIPNIYLPMYLASQLNSYRFVYLSTCLFICLSTHLIISTMCVHTYIYIIIYTYLCICSYVFAEVDMPEFEAISVKELSMPQKFGPVSSGSLWPFELRHTLCLFELRHWISFSLFQLRWLQDSPT